MRKRRIYDEHRFLYTTKNRPRRGVVSLLLYDMGLDYQEISHALGMTRQQVITSVCNTRARDSMLVRRYAEHQTILERRQVEYVNLRTWLTHHGVDTGRLAALNLGGYHELVA